MLIRYNHGWLLFMSLTLLLPACSTGPELDLTLHDSDRGTITLERFANRSFQAAHPITLPPDTLARVLRGILVRDEHSLVQNLTGSKSETLRAFSDDEVSYLTPLLVDGLTRAAADQQVGFKIPQTGAPVYSERTGAGLGSSEPPLHLAPKEITSGFLYAYGKSLYLTITQYRYRPERVDTINMANRRLPDETGLVHRTILFTPGAAKRPDSYLDSRSPESTLVIDYELLARLPVDSGPGVTGQVAPAADSATTAVQPPAAKGGPTKKDPDVEALRKELDDIKRQLAEQEAQRSLAQPKKPATPKSP